MRVAFDILGATEKSGGMRLHASEIVRAWSETFPDDALLLIAGTWATSDFADANVDVVVVNNEKVTSRAFGQLLKAPRAAKNFAADVLISLSPIVSPFGEGPKRLCFQHDWRHKKNPQEFPLAQRLYRKLWEVSANRADLNVCISAKAERETRQFAPKSRTFVIENGRDHARRWASHEHAAPDTPHVVTFGHHNNKRPELVIDAWAGVAAEHPEARLTVLGARDAYAAELKSRTQELGISSAVDFPGFVTPQEYERSLSTAAVVVMASTDEGFGLPIAEAEYFGIPAVITSDSGMSEIFGDYPLVADPTPASMGRALATALSAQRAGSGARALWSWDDVVREMRSQIGNL
ncbi:glycosyltransferase [Microbacterium oleivorans]|uniref:glycosyltransferase n=1 Tax=Microbacterium oleivorans TaxID=273677 RepID=UPI0007672659|nr:glycosyltransferase [Microbacterium oleivorans]